MPRHKGQVADVDHDADAFRREVLAACERLAASGSGGGVAEGSVARVAGLHRSTFWHFLRGGRPLRDPAQRQAVIEALARLARNAGTSVDLPALEGAGCIVAPTLVVGASGHAAPSAHGALEAALSAARQALLFTDLVQYGQMRALATLSLRLLGAEAFPPEGVDRASLPLLRDVLQGNPVAIEAYIMAAQARGIMWHGLGAEPDFWRAARAHRTALWLGRDLVPEGRQHDLLADARHHYGKALLELAARVAGDDWEWRALRPGGTALANEALAQFALERRVRPRENAIFLSHNWRNTARAARIVGQYDLARTAQARAEGHLSVARQRDSADHIRVAMLLDRARWSIAETTSRSSQRRAEGWVLDAIAIASNAGKTNHLSLGLGVLADLRASRLGREAEIRQTALTALMSWPAVHDTRDTGRTLAMALDLGVTERDLYRALEAPGEARTHLEALEPAAMLARLAQVQARLARARNGAAVS